MGVLRLVVLVILLWELIRLVRKMKSNPWEVLWFEITFCSNNSFSTDSMMLPSMTSLSVILSSIFVISSWKAETSVDFLFLIDKFWKARLMLFSVGDCVMIALMVQYTLKFYKLDFISYAFRVFFVFVFSAFTYLLYQFQKIPVKNISVLCSFNYLHMHVNFVL